MIIEFEEKNPAYSLIRALEPTRLLELRVGQTKKAFNIGNANQGLFNIIKCLHFSI